MFHDLGLSLFISDRDLVGGDFNVGLPAEVWAECRDLRALERHPEPSCGELFLLLGWGARGLPRGCPKPLPKACGWLKGEEEK